MTRNIFDEFSEDQYTVFQDKAVLSPTYLPPEWVGREDEERQLAQWVFQGVRDGSLPPMIRVYGGPGTGKTMVVQHVLDQYQTHRGDDAFQSVYVNVKQCRTVVSAANALLAAMNGNRIPPNLGLDRIMHEFWTTLRSRGESHESLYLALILDEVDSLAMDRHYDPSDFLYQLLRYQQILHEPRIQLMLVTIANSPAQFEAMLDGRVRSSMGSTELIFQPYDPATLEVILADRVADAFHPDVMDRDLIQILAWQGELSGDVRKALDVLQRCGEIANKRATTITFDLMIEALQQVSRDNIHQILAGLPYAEQAILRNIAQLTLSRPETTTRAVFTHYKQHTFSVVGLKESRVYDIITQLATLGLISTWPRAQGGGGYEKVIRLNRDPEAVLSATNQFRRGSHPIDARTFAKYYDENDDY
jgi:orc1/cdc6 family replication initiation protein